MQWNCSVCRVWISIAGFQRACARSTGNTKHNRTKSDWTNKQTHTFTDWILWNPLFSTADCAIVIHNLNGNVGFFSPRSPKFTRQTIATYVRWFSESKCHDPLHGMHRNWNQINSMPTSYVIQNYLYFQFHSRISVDPKRLSVQANTHTQITQSVICNIVGVSQLNWITSQTNRRERFAWFKSSYCFRAVAFFLSFEQQVRSTIYEQKKCDRGRKQILNIFKLAGYFIDTRYVAFIFDIWTLYMGTYRRLERAWNAENALKRSCPCESDLCLFN